MIALLAPIFGARYAIAIIYGIQETIVPQRTNCECWLTASPPCDCPMKIYETRVKTGMRAVSPESSRKPLCSRMTMSVVNNPPVIK